MTSQDESKMTNSQCLQECTRHAWLILKNKERHTIKEWRVFSKGWANTTIRASAGYIPTNLWHMQPMLTTRTQTILKFKQMH